MDHFNDLSFSCSVGTSDDNGVWVNRSDPAGTIMSCLVWFLIGYSNLTMTCLAQTEGIPAWASATYGILSSLALAAHAKTSLTDPGSVPASAVPTEEQRRQHNAKLSMCSQCQTFKPPGSHHCRICNRCISRMDHQYVMICYVMFDVVLLHPVAHCSLCSMACQSLTKCWLLPLDSVAGHCVGVCVCAIVRFEPSCPWMNSKWYSHTSIVCVALPWWIVFLRVFSAQLETMNQ